jgi:pimeloyl-ACP methyl ester carboxylesterase
MTRIAALVCLAALIVACGDNHAAAPAAAAAAPAEPPKWQTLPIAQTLPEPWRRGPLPINGVELYFTTYGDKDPTVMFLHGGLASSEYWGNQLPALAGRYRVVLVDSRGHGRSSRDDKPLTYELMASDVLTLMNRLLLQKVSLVGWSDGAIVALDLAMNHPERLERVFAFGANFDPSGVKPDAEKNPTFARFVDDARGVYQNISPAPDDYDAFHAAVAKMWATEPHYTLEQLGAIKVPVTIADGEHDEAIERAHTEQLARAIPGAKLVILPGVSHFAMLQDPKQFNDALLAFLEGRQGESMDRSR